eukprot:SAG11_NODE_24284_length_375_cov_1.688406_1_plen_65_part_10
MSMPMPRHITPKSCGGFSSQLYTGAQMAVIWPRPCPSSYTSIPLYFLGVVGAFFRSLCGKLGCPM